MKVAYYYGLAGLLVGLVIGLSWSFGTKTSIADAKTETVPVILTEVPLDKENTEQSIQPLPTEQSPPVTSSNTSTVSGVSHRFSGMDLVDARLAMAFDEIAYSTQGLDEFAQSVNNAVWRSPDDNHNQAVIMRIQALLNWHHHSVGSVDGVMSNNTIKAMHIFQQLHHLPTTNEMNAQTWQKLTANPDLMRQPVLVRYQLVDKDFAKVNSRGRSTYKNSSEAIGEKFHMSPTLLKQLNKGVAMSSGNTITVYNPYEPNKTPIYRVIVKRDQNILYAYDEKGQLTATYPTTVNLARTPKGTYKVANRVLDPVYNKDFSNKHTAVPAGPNNPVGRVWIGIDKPSFGIHGSPEPERISQQESAGCVRLTNWDALGLFGTIENGATVVFD